jgi:hypothetical protein
MREESERERQKERERERERIPLTLDVGLEGNAGSSEQRRCLLDAIQLGHFVRVD